MANIEGSFGAKPEKDSNSPKSLWAGDLATHNNASEVPEKTITQLDTLPTTPKLIVEPNHDERLS